MPEMFTFKAAVAWDVTQKTLLSLSAGFVWIKAFHETGLMIPWSDKGQEIEAEDDEEGKKVVEEEEALLEGVEDSKS